MRRTLLICLPVLIGIAPEPGFGEEVEFVRELINRDSQFSAAAAIDVDSDGRLDIVSGGYWYKAPNWSRLPLREVQQIRGRYDDYSNLPLDVNEDGLFDLVSVNYRSSSLYWVENRGPRMPWHKHSIDRPGRSETGRLADINGDGRLDVLPNGVDFAAWYELRGGDWVRHELPQMIIGHGLGFGDIDGDGRGDLVAATGWLENSGGDSIDWKWHPEFRLHRDCSIPILVTDVDFDGDADLVWGRGHNVGLYWMEQRATGGGRSWTQHPIDTQWSQAHSIMLGDVNSDGRHDLIAGKRYMGHDGKDPGENDPLVVYWYEFNVEEKVFRRHLISWGNRCGFDLDPKAVDIDNDGDLDIVAPTRGSLYLLRNLRIGRSKLPPSSTMPALPSYNRSEQRELLFYKTTAGSRSDVSTAEDWGIRRWHILRGMEAVMGRLPGPSQRVPLDVRVIDEQQAEGYVRRRISFAADAVDRVTADLLIPDELTPPAAAMLCLHPGSAPEKANSSAIAKNLMHGYADELARRGFVCLVPQYPGLGDYRYDFRAAEQYASGTMKGIWNHVRGLDLLESLPQVHPDRMGVIGHSLGGRNAIFLAAFDLRIRAIVTSCGFTSFDKLGPEGLATWSTPHEMPRIGKRFGNDPQQMPFDFHEAVAALAPRPVFLAAPVADPSFEVSGVRQVVAAARRVYQIRDRAANLSVAYPECGHQFPDAIRQQVYDWLGRVLAGR